MKTRLVMGTILVTILAVSGGVNADLLNVTATVRDFSWTSSPSAFGYVVEVATGFVGATIGADRKPVYIGPSTGTATTQGPDSFNQWYNDVPGVNLSKTITLAFDNGMSSPGGIYTFYTESFFPIDGELGGNQGNDHNFLFTMEMHTQFMYQPGQVFNYRSDDDLFVFINDRLVLDQGGVWPARDDSVNLDTLGLTAGGIYSYDVFFAERHPVDSVLRVDLAPVPAPAAVLLGILGLSAAGWRLRRFA